MYPPGHPEHEPERIPHDWDESLGGWLRWRNMVRRMEQEEQEGPKTVKAKYILAAIAAMRAADDIGYTMEPAKMARVLNDLLSARHDLELESGLGEIDIQVEESHATE